MSNAPTYTAFSKVSSFLSKLYSLFTISVFIACVISFKNAISNNKKLPKVGHTSIKLGEFLLCAEKIIDKLW